MADFDQLLATTSRTFALTIPFLPDPVRHEVTLAYLLLRIADTIEDDPKWPVDHKVSSLQAFAALLKNPAASADAFLNDLREHPLTTTDACRVLMAQSDEVVAALHALSPGARDVIVKHVLLTIEGMADTVKKGAVELSSLEELKTYCYIVAGLVGELLTELFLLHARSLGDSAEALRKTARAFGEGLQLTNILKDEGEDAKEGRRFLPRGVSRETVFSLAREDLHAAITYVKTLASAGAPQGILAFTTIPVRLAVETLQAVEKRGAGAKVSRERVAEILKSVGDALEGKGPLFP